MLRLSLNERVAMAERLAAARQISGLSLRDVASDLGLSPHAVHQWERGSLPTLAATRARLAELYGVPVERLFAEVESHLAAARDKIA